MLNGFKCVFMEIKMLMQEFFGLYISTIIEGRKLMNWLNQPKELKVPYSKALLPNNV